jgi:3-dehydroquinate dehydratase-2
MQMKIALIEGPLLDKLGVREPEIYGSGFSRADVEKKLLQKAESLGVEIVFLSSYLEGELAQIIAECDADGIIINPGAYTHTSILLRDVLIFKKIPFVETHLSNIFSREEFRKTSYLSDVANGFICGFGTDAYILALEAVFRCLSGV